MHQGCFAAQLAEEEADERRRRCRRRQRARPSVAEKEGAEAEEEAAWRQTTYHTEALHRGPCTARKGERAHMLGIYGSRQALPSAFSESPWNQSWVGLGHTFWLDCTGPARAFLHKRNGLGSTRFPSLHTSILHPRPGWRALPRAHTSRHTTLSMISWPKVAAVPERCASGLWPCVHAHTNISRQLEGEYSVLWRRSWRRRGRRQRRRRRRQRRGRRRRQWRRRRV